MKYIPWNPLAINGARNLISAAVIGVYLKLTGHRLVLNRKVAVSALCISLTSALFTVANKLTTAGNAIVLQYTAPVFVLLYLLVVKGKKPHKSDLITMLFVLAGVLCFFMDSSSEGSTRIGDLLSLLSGATYAGVFMMGDSENSDALSSSFYGMLLNMAVGLPFLLKQDLSSGGPAAWTAILALGFIQLGVAYIFLSKGLERTSPVAASLIGGLEPVLNPLLVAIFYGEILSPLSLAGAGIVLTTILVYNVRNALKKEVIPPQE